MAPGKCLVKMFDGREVEMVFIPEETRGTLCISSQVGCTLACKFCHTGTQTLVRNLEAGEIVAQILLAKDILNDWKKEGRQLTNIVYMGMGEPFFNYENVAKSVTILNDADGLDFAARRITISTSGLVPEILRCSAELKTSLAISLHATNDALRSDIMAINKKYPLKDLLGACKSYNQQNPGKKVLFEYVLLKGVNDQEEHARELIKLINKFNINAKINLIPFNQWKGCGYEPSSFAQIDKFQKILKDADLIAPIRKTRGDDVMAACGQLKSASQRPTWREKNTKNPEKTS
jgi:23S rRNA (adenine2503-C2)-methyltransferase